LHLGEKFLEVPEVECRSVSFADGGYPSLQGVLHVFGCARRIALELYIEVIEGHAWCHWVVGA
jgi:hypothetical protein